MSQNQPPKTNATLWPGFTDCSLSYADFKIVSRAFLLQKAASDLTALVKKCVRQYRSLNRMLERFAQEALGHNSKAVHLAYAKHAQVTLPSLEKYERNAAVENVIPMRLQQGQAVCGG